MVQEESKQRKHCTLILLNQENYCMRMIYSMMEFVLNRDRLPFNLTLDVNEVTVHGRNQFVQHQVFVALGESPVVFIF